MRWLLSATLGLQPLRNLEKVLESKSEPNESKKEWHESRREPAESRNERNESKSPLHELEARQVPLRPGLAQQQGELGLVELSTSRQQRLYHLQMLAECSMNVG